MTRALCFSILVVFSCSPAAAAASPNLVAVVTDDQGRWAMGAYGNDEVHTPNMDRIAREGALLTNAIAATPVCSPSRATYMSGLYATQLRITDWIASDEAAEGCGLTAVAWPQVLQQHGYHTALIGKWHLGEQPLYHPTRKGFDHFMGFLGGGNRPMNPTLEVAGRTQQLQGALPDILTDDAIDFIRKNRDGRFAVCLHYRAPHMPYLPVPEQDMALYKNLDPTIPEFKGLDRDQVKQQTKAYYASISSVDRNLGRLLRALDELGLTKTTLLIFTSDHGYNLGRHGVNTKGNGQWMAGGVIGPKRPNMWETSITVPLAVRWPGVVQPGSVIDYPVSNVDMFRTVLGALGVPVPEDSPARGIDYSPLLRGRSLPPRDPLFGQYDLHNNGLAYLRMARSDRYKFIRHFHSRGMDEFYDLATDPGEKANLARRNRRRTPPQEEAIQALRERLERFMVSVDDPLLHDPY